MSNKSRWTREEELQLIKSISTGQNIESISKTHNRTPSAIDLRLKKIVYENMQSGKSISHLSKLLKLPSDKIQQYFYSYKEFLEKHNVKTQEPTIIKQDENPLQDKLKSAFKESQGGSKLPNNIVHDLEIENKILKLIVDNRELRHRLNKLIKEGRVDKSINDIIQEIKDKYK